MTSLMQYYIVIYKLMYSCVVLPNLNSWSIIKLLKFKVKSHFFNVCKMIFEEVFGAKNSELAEYYVAIIFSSLLI